MNNKNGLLLGYIFSIVFSFNLYSQPFCEGYEFFCSPSTGPSLVEISKLSEGQIEAWFYKNGYEYEGKEWTEDGIFYAGVTNDTYIDTRCMFLVKNSQIIGSVYTSNFTLSAYNHISDRKWNKTKKMWKKNNPSVNFLVDNDLSLESEVVQFSRGRRQVKIERKQGEYTNTRTTHYLSWPDVEKVIVEGVDITQMDTYSLEPMVELFMKDLHGSSKLLFHNITTPPQVALNLPNENFYKQEVEIEFKTLPDNIIALSYGKGIPNKIIIEVDPTNWKNSSLAKKWYVLYHELGHDVLNFKHGQGGKMMFNFVDREYNWGEFKSDREKMFDIFLRNYSVK